MGKEMITHAQAQVGHQLPWLQSRMSLVMTISFDNNNEQITENIEAS